MGYAIKTRELAGMMPGERTLVLEEVVAAAKAPRNGQAAVIDNRIRQFEERYERTSDELIRGLADGKIRETAEIAQWLFWLDIRANRVNGKARPK